MGSKRIARLLLPFATCFLWVITSMAQSGHVIRTIATEDALLNGDSLSIYFHIPASYDPQIESKLIIGFHGLGDPNNSQQIREYLTPVGDSINAIVMCPDPYLQDQPRSEAVLHIAYDSVMTWYNIDPAQVYITGYSAGSDVAARYVFGDPQYAMKGLIWHSPGFFFSPDLSDPQSIPPVCLCSGTQDFTSIVQTNLLNNNLNNSGIPYEYIAMPGVGHTMDYPAFVQTMLQCISFIDSHYATGLADSSEKRNFQFIPNIVSAGDRMVIRGEEMMISTAFLYDLNGRFITPLTVENKSMVAPSIESGVYLVKILGAFGQTLGITRILVK
jgi:hypothetical protein